MDKSTSKWRMRNGSIAILKGAPALFPGKNIKAQPLILGLINDNPVEWYADGRYFLDVDHKYDLMEIAPEDNGAVGIMPQTPPDPIHIIEQKQLDKQCRDAIALEAMKAMIARGFGADAKDVAFHAYELADAMIAESKA